MPLAYVAWRAGTTYRVVVPVRRSGNRFLGSLKGLQIRALLPLGLIGNVSGEERQEGHQQQMSPQSAIDRWGTKKQGYIEIRKRDWGGGGGDLKIEVITCIKRNKMVVFVVNQPKI
jgi:hypothetical protein